MFQEAQNSSRAYDKIIMLLKRRTKEMTLSQEDGQLYYKLWSEVEIIDRYIKENPELRRNIRRLFRGGSEGLMETLSWNGI